MIHVINILQLDKVSSSLYGENAKGDMHVPLERGVVDLEKSLNLGEN